MNPSIFLLLMRTESRERRRFTQEILKISRSVSKTLSQIEVIFLMTILFAIISFFMNHSDASKLIPVLRKTPPDRIINSMFDTEFVIFCVICNIFHQEPVKSFEVLAQYIVFLLTASSLNDMRGGYWYPENSGSRKFLFRSRNLGGVLNESRNLVFMGFLASQILEFLATRSGGVSDFC